ncbi:MAG: QueT transporter family protein [Clostridia bacterium]|nr:QueT transporter family protein [Clostridia bacterium]
MHKRKSKIEYIITAAIIASAYAGLTYLCSVWGLAYGPIQLRISEVLTILPLFTPAAIPGLAIGCFFANIGSFNIADLLFGTLATLAAAILTYFLRNIKIKGLPIFAFFPPVIVNALVIGFEIAIFYLKADNFFWGFIISALEVGAGEFIVCFAFGIPFYLVVKKYRIFNKDRFKEK